MNFYSPTGAMRRILDRLQTVIDKWTINLTKLDIFPSLDVVAVSHPLVPFPSAFTRFKETSSKLQKNV